MTYLEKLDLILITIEPIINHKSAKDLQPLFKDKFSPAELSTLLEKLYGDGNVDFANSFGYRINANGRILISNKGYVEKSRKENELYENSIKTLKVSEDALISSNNSLKIGKLNTIWVVITAILTLLSILTTIYFQYCKKN